MPKGKLVVASACENSDLFWSMRGGGGGFGVLISVTSVAHPDEPLTRATLTMNTTATESTENRNSKFWEAVDFLYSRLPALSEAGLMNQFYLQGLNSTADTFTKIASSINDTTRVSLGMEWQALSVSGTTVKTAF